MNHSQLLLSRVATGGVKIIFHSPLFCIPFYWMYRRTMVS